MLFSLSRFLFFASLMLAVGLGLAASLAAESDEGAPMLKAKSDSVKEVDVEIRGVFEGVLPKTEEKNHLSLLVHPHFGDFHRKRYLRAPVGLRYGLTDRWDVSAELEGYVSHGLDGVPAFAELGLSEVQVTTKYRADWSLVPGWEMAGRLRYTHPVDHPPLELTDGYEHIMPMLTFAQEIERWPGAELFWGTGLDWVRLTHIRGELDENEFGDHANIFTGGLVWQRGKRVYTFEATYATTALLGDSAQDRIQLRPAVIFRIPDRFTFHSKGDWRMGVALKWIYGPDGHDFGLSVKFRGDFDLKKLLRR